MPTSSTSNPAQAKSTPPPPPSNAPALRPWAAAAPTPKRASPTEVLASTSPREPTRHERRTLRATAARAGAARGGRSRSGGRSPSSSSSSPPSLSPSLLESDSASGSGRRRRARARSRHHCPLPRRRRRQWSCRMGRAPPPPQCRLLSQRPPLGSQSSSRRQPCPRLAPREVTLGRRGWHATGRSLEGMGKYEGAGWVTGD